MSDAAINGLAGAGGGIVAQLLTYPLQAVNTREQTERKAKAAVLTRSNADISAVGLPHRPPKHAQSTLHKLWEVVRYEGWGGLYRGLLPSLVGTVASQAVYYYFYQLLKNEAEARAQRRKRSGSGDGSLGMFGALVVAAMAGCANVLLTNPIWVVVTQMQTHAQAHKKDVAAAGGVEKPVPQAAEQPPLAPTVHHKVGAFDVVRELYKESGILGFWRGVIPTLIMVSNPAIQFTIYETLLKRLTSKRVHNSHGVKYVSALEVFLLGAIAKLGATVMTYPLLVVKSRLQAKQSKGVDKSAHYTGTLDALVKMIRYEGVAGFYRGMSTKIVQSVVAAAVLFAIKEELVKSARSILQRQPTLRKPKKLA